MAARWEYFKRMPRRKFLSLAARAGVSLAGLSLVGCVGKKERAASGSFIEGTSGGDAETLNWILAADATSASYVSLTMDGLIAYDNKLNIQLRWLERDIETSKDGLEYLVTLRSDLRWSDGSQVKGEDFVYTMKNLMFSDWLNYNYRGDWQEVVDGKTIFVEPKVVDSASFKIVRQTVDPEFYYTVTDLMAYPKSLVSKYEGDIKAFTQAKELNELSYTGNLGPYRFKEWIRNGKFVVERNPDYYLGKQTGAPFFKEYVIQLFATSPARHAALEAGDITYAPIEPEYAKKFKEMQRINVYTVPTSSYTLMSYNHRDNGWEGLRNKRVRQAISMAISKEQIIQNVRLGFGEPAFSFIPKVSPWYVDEGIMKFGVGELYSKQRAREILKEEGYGKVKLSLVTTTGSKLAESVALLVKQELAEIGIEVEPKFMTWETLLRKYMMNKVPGTAQEPRFNNGAKATSEEPWDLMLSGHSVDLLQPSGSEVFYASDGGLNSEGYSNKRVDELFKKVRSKEALDKEARRKMYGELSRIISEDQPADFLYFPLANHGFKSSVKGIDAGVSLGYNRHEWYFGE